MQHSGLVLKSTGSWYQVLTDGGEMLDLRLKGKIRLKGLKYTNPIAVGDNVVFELSESGDGVINEILPRRNYIIRKSFYLPKFKWNILKIYTVFLV